MNGNLERARAAANRTRYRAGQPDGHYESFFLRANHPTRPQAFWIRYTIFSPHGRPQDAIGELWAIYFDGDTGRHVAAKTEVPFAQCEFRAAEFLARVGDSTLAPGQMRGRAASSGHAIAWDLSFGGDSAPLFLFPLKLYDARLPKAKSLVGLPMALFRGSIDVDGVVVDIRDWVGSQNHNWGSKHTDHYAWGQVAGFDTHPDSFLEVATARIKIGPFWTPFMTPLVLRHQGEEIALNQLGQTFRAKGSFDYFTWHFTSETEAVRVDGRIHAPREAFVGLNYYNPPGGNKHCLNSKIAACELTLQRRSGSGWGASEVLTSRHRAAFEILTDDRSHGVAIRA